MNKVSSWCHAVRETMNFYGWQDGLLLNHIHAKMGYKDTTTMDCLANGSNGMWAAVCEEGAAVGHCSSAVTILNLIRHGNTKVLDKYNCEYLRKAAIEVTKITTKAPPHPKQIVYGERATDLVFGAGGMGGKEAFDISKFFGLDEEQRITTLATPDMIANRLKHLFGNHEQFTKEIAVKMKAEMIKDLNLDIKSEYHSPYGIALLFERVGGKPTKEMLSKLDEHKTNFEIHNKIRQEIHNAWDKYTIKNVEKTRGTGSTAILASIRKKKTSKRLLGIQKSTPVVTGAVTVSSDATYVDPDFDKQTSEELGLLTPKSLSGTSKQHFKELLNTDHDLDERKIDINDNDFLTFDKFYHGFMQPYFGCYRCQITKNALKVLDVDNSGTIEWHEFCTFVDWTLNQYSDIIVGSSSGATNINEMAEVCLRLTFEKGIIPAMRDRVNENLNPFSDRNFHVIQPKNYVEHTATVIFLHGIADFDEEIGNGTWAFNQLTIANVQNSFPYIRFVLPTADKIAISDANDSLHTAWFDVKHKSTKDNKNKFQNLNGLNGSIEKIKALIRQEMKAYNISSKRIMLAGFNQGAVLALLASLSMYKEFGCVVCANSFLLGMNKQEFDDNMHIEKHDTVSTTNAPVIYWLDAPWQKFYQDFEDDFSKKCSDYLKKDCQFNVFYHKYDREIHLRKPQQSEFEPTEFDKMLAHMIGKHLPPLEKIQN